MEYILTGVREFRQKNLGGMVLYLGVAAIFLAMTLICQAYGKDFLTVTNIFNIITQASIVAIIAIGASLIILTGGIDLAPGSVVGFVGIVGGLALKSGVPLWAVVLLCLAAGVISGVISGLFVSYGKVPAFIVTLGMMQILRGGAMVLCGGIAVSGFPSELKLLMNAKLFGRMPISVFYVAVLYIAICFVMKYTRFGRRVYALGGNIKAARLSGIAVNRELIKVYALGGLFAAIGGVMMLARLSYADPNAGSGYEMQAIAAAVIGGISLSGGKGNIANTLVGALILSMLTCGLQIMNMPTFYQSIISGLVIVLAVFADKHDERHQE